MTPGAAQLLQRFGRIRGFAVDVETRTQLLRELSAFGPEPDGRHLAAELARELNAEVAQPTDSLHGDEVAGGGAAPAQGIERRGAGAEQWGRLHI
jgi:hypothetical protein